MADKLGEIGKVLSSIYEAVKATKSLRAKDGEMRSILEQTSKQSEAIEELQIPGEPVQLHELKKSARMLRDSGARLQTWLLNFGSEIDSFERFVRAKIRGNSIPQEVMAEFCTALERMHDMASGFSDAFDKFVKHLGEAQKLATRLTDEMSQKDQDQQQQADGRRKKGAAGTAGLVLAGVGLVALGFFTGGAAWVAAGVAGGVACGVGAAAVGVTTAVSVGKMRQLARDILKDANRLGAIASGLKGSADKAGGLKLDQAALEYLETALEFFRRDQEKNERIAQLEAKLRSLGHSA